MKVYLIEVTAPLTMADNGADVDVGEKMICHVSEEGQDYLWTVYQFEGQGKAFDMTLDEMAGHVKRIGNEFGPVFIDWDLTSKGDVFSYPGAAMDILKTLNDKAAPRLSEKDLEAARLKSAIAAQSKAVARSLHRHRKMEEKILHDLKQRKKEIEEALNK